MDYVNFRSKRFFNAIALSIAVLSMSENSVFCEETSVKETVSCNCKGEKKYVSYSDLRINKDSMFLMGSRGVILVTELGCDENGYYIYDNDIDG